MKKRIPHPHCLDCSDSRHPRHAPTRYVLFWLVLAALSWVAELALERVKGWHKAVQSAALLEAYNEGVRDGRIAEIYYNMLPPISEKDSLRVQRAIKSRRNKRKH